MKLTQLLPYIHYDKVLGDPDVNIDGLCHNDQQLEVGDAFFCFKGGNYDSHDFVQTVVDRGVSVLFVEHPLSVNITQVVVKNGRDCMTECARAYYGFPDKKLKIVAVTGTNGKTTTTYMLQSIFKVAQKKCAVVGTIGIVYANKMIAPELTTPDPIFLYETFKDMVEEGIEYVFMEVSAHALYYNKIKGIKFEVGIFTNCTQDHLDFFGNFKSYASWKKSLFLSNQCKYGIVNVDDKIGLEIVKEGDHILSYGLDNPADIFAVDIKSTLTGTSFLLNTMDSISEVCMPILAKYNVYNAMAAAGCSLLLGVDIDCIVKGLASMRGVMGRMEKVGSYQGATIFIDYAHTPDGLEKSLQTLKPLCRGSLILVFGCGGNRDKSKRPIMGAIATRYADFTIITSDNPRYEDPYDIISQIESGVKENYQSYVTVTDRVMAIEYALKIIKDGDILLIAGKGGENYQEIMGIKHEYSDHNIVKNMLG